MTVEELIRKLRKCTQVAEVIWVQEFDEGAGQPMSIVVDDEYVVILSDDTGSGVKGVS